jgi:hypothetical protein
MPDRKSSPAAGPKARGKAAHVHVLPGDSETTFTAKELERIVDAVWEHGRVMPDADAASWRQDACGAWMMREHFGDADSPFGWKIEKVVPGGPGDRLRPFNCANRFDIADGRPHCGITADRSLVPAERQAGPPRNKRP